MRMRRGKGGVIISFHDMWQGRSSAANARYQDYSWKCRGLVNFKLGLIWILLSCWDDKCMSEPSRIYDSPFEQVCTSESKSKNERKCMRETRQSQSPRSRRRGLVHFSIDGILEQTIAATSFAFDILLCMRLWEFPWSLQRARHHPKERKRRLVGSNWGSYQVILKKTIAAKSR